MQLHVHCGEKRFLSHHHAGWVHFKLPKWVKSKLALTQENTSEGKLDLHCSLSFFTNEGCIPSTEDAEDPLPVATPEQKFRASLESFGSRHEEPERIGQPISRVKRQADRERVLDLLA